MYSLIFAAATAALQPAVQTEDIRPVYFQKAEVEKKNFTGTIKVRQRSPEQKAYYLELNDGKIIHISTNVEENTLEPFLNEQTCEYQVAVVFDETGKAHTPGQLEAFATGRAGIDSVGKKNKPLPWEFILQRYVRPGVREILRHYDKLESDDIVCAFPPTDAKPECRSLWQIMSKDHRDDLTLLEVIELDDGTGRKFNAYALLRLSKSSLDIIPFERTPFRDHIAALQSIINANNEVEVNINMYCVCY